uniref:YHS domain-containing (seleno)protein n=1 Tax=Gelidibacter sp. TaxID=2018083 RepID=UPI004048FCC8
MKKIVLLVFVLALPFFGWSQSSSARAKDFNLENNLAIKGYDPVAYFIQKKAIKGKKELALTHQGVTYYFSSNENKEAFLKNPETYEPQYGGWCAFAIGDDNKKVSINPETFKIVDGKLYLFYNAYFNNTLKSWNKNESQLKAQADKNWQAIIN